MAERGKRREKGVAERGNRRRRVVAERGKRSDREGGGGEGKEIENCSKRVERDRNGSRMV